MNMMSLREREVVIKLFWRHRTISSKPTIAKPTPTAVR